MGSKAKRAAASQSGKRAVFLVGDDALVREYAELCQTRGYTVLTAPAQRPETRTTRLPVPGETLVALELTNVDRETKKANLAQLDRALPADRLILSTSVTVTATEQTTWIDHKHRLVGLGAIPGCRSDGLVEIAPTLHSPKETIEVAHRFVASLGKEIEIIQDRIGMVLPRVLCQIINEAAFALNEEIASPRDIDLAVRLGLNYPRGPIEWANAIGFDQVQAVLQALHKDTGEERYRVSPLLTQMVHGGRWWEEEPGKAEEETA